MMIWGETDVVQRLDPIFSAPSPGIGDIPRTVGRDKINGTAEQGYLHCGPYCAGHFVKMVHNGMEYGIMAAYAEGLAILPSANVGKQVNVAANAETTPLRDPQHLTLITASFRPQYASSAPTEYTGSTSAPESAIAPVVPLSL